MADKSVNILIKGDSRNAQTAFQKVEAEANKLNKQIKKSASLAMSLNSLTKQSQALWEW